ncbi:histidine--tRNA ligase [Pelagibacteraceae bacterium]|nr:histidine--tRNA ligase [Pelagibacteraceae bacterium]
MKLRSVRGTHDIFGEEIEKFNLISKIVSKNAYLNDFKEVQTPIFEFSDLFAKPLGEQSDVVLKEMYSFEDRNNEILTLRPEYTTPMIRAAITNNLLNDLPLKIFGIGPMFRRERPQKGRYRQFNQINFEILGTKDFLADVELILLSNNILKELLPKSKIRLQINSLGDKKTLIDFKTSLTRYFNANKKKLSEDSIKKINTNPLRILDSKNEEDIEISKSSPKIYEHLTNEAKKHYEDLKKALNLLEINFEENINLVRGLDYYCNTVFEYKSDNLGSQDTLLGGGRYDGLIKVLGGPDIPGIGWAAGIERIALLMEYEKKINSTIHIAVTNEKFTDYFLHLKKYLNENSISSYWNYKYNLKKSFTKANTSSASHIIIIGENEFNGNFFTIKNLMTGEQKELKLNQIFNHINDKSR